MDKEILVVGIFSGVSTALFLYFVNLLWSGWLIEWYREITYKGEDVSGSWQWTDKDEEHKSTNTMHMVLKQKAHAVTGFLKVSYDGQDQTFSISYLIDGEYRDNYLLLTCRSKKFNDGFLIVRLNNDGTLLNGHFTFTDAAKNIANTLPIAFERKRSVA